MRRQAGFWGRGHRLIAGWGAFINTLKGTIRHHSGHMGQHFQNTNNKRHTISPVRKGRDLPHSCGASSECFCFYQISFS